MLANAFARKLRAKYLAEGKAEGRAEGRAIGMAKARAIGEARVLSAFEEVARRQGMEPEDIRSIVQEARDILRNGRA